MAASLSHAAPPAINGRGVSGWSAADMAWLLAGSILLTIAFVLPGSNGRAARIFAFLLLLAAFAGAFSVYADRKVFAAVGGGMMVGFLCARPAGRRPLWVRFAAIAAGAAFVAFALFGPADGLF